MTGAEKPRDQCGVVGVALSPRTAAAHDTAAAHTARAALQALQHRGEESAGIAALTESGIALHRGLGRVAEVFEDAAHLASLPGRLAIGHTRYPTAGANRLAEAQPFVRMTPAGPVAVAHNGHLTNQRALRAELLERGAVLTTTSDSELMVALLADPMLCAASDWPGRLRALMRRVEGAYSLAVLTPDGVYGVRDPLGFRPLCVGRLPDGDVLASESCALDALGASLVHEVAPGELVRLTGDGATRLEGLRSVRQAQCLFEHVYVSRALTRLGGEEVGQARRRMGAHLWAEAPVDADLVLPVPDSACEAARGFAAAGGLAIDESVLVRNATVGRTFLRPAPHLRRLGVALKYHAVAGALRGRRVVLVDDSIVRGTTIIPLVALLRRAGAREVHVRIGSPPIRHSCFMGIDMPDVSELLAASEPDVRALCVRLGADSLAFLSLAGLVDAVAPGRPAAHCTACFTGDYPLRVRDLEPGVAPQRDQEIMEV